MYFLQDDLVSEPYTSDTAVSVTSSATATATTLHHRRTPPPLTCITTARTPTTSSSSPVSSPHTTDSTSAPCTTIEVVDSSSSSLRDDDPVDVSAESVMIARWRPVTTFTLADLQNDLDDSDLASVSRLSSWDYGIFDLADQAPSTVLSQVSSYHTKSTNLQNFF